MPQILPIPPLIHRFDARSDLVLDDNGTEVAIYSVTFEAVGGAAITLGFSSDGVTQLVGLLQGLLAATLEKQLGGGSA